eukprot:9780787-Alexandrium_andersonii.AAC.1
MWWSGCLGSPGSSRLAALAASSFDESPIRLVRPRRRVNPLSGGWTAGRTRISMPTWPGRLRRRKGEG